MTEWGRNFAPEAVEHFRQRSQLKRVVDVEDCANAFVMLAQNASITGQSIQVSSAVA